MKTRIEISSICCLFLALLLLAVPVPWILGAVLAALFHELSHWGMVLITGGRIADLEIKPTGAFMKTAEMPAWKEALCSLAGPAGSFLLLLLSDYFPRLAVCGLVQGMFNLLPICPLDGGRILYCILTMLFSKRTAKNAAKYVGIIMLAVLGAAAVGISIYQKRLDLISVIVLILLSKEMDGKFPCKDG